MVLTLNQIVSRIRTLALSHYQINNFYFGDSWEFTANGEIVYPGCFCTLVGSGINRDEKLFTYSFRIYFLNLVGVATKTEENETEVLSDMSSVAGDFMALLNDTQWQDDWDISTIINLTPITEGLEDMVAGFSLDVDISTEFKSDLCQVPSSEVTFTENFDMARTKILTYTGTGSEGSSFTPTGLADKTVLAVYRAGTYKRAIVILPTNSDTIQVVGTDLGSYKGILSSTGAVALQTGDALLSGEVLDFLIWST